MECPKCKRIIPDDARLCCYCGRTIVKSVSRKRRGNGTGTARKSGSTWEAVASVGWVFDEEKNKHVSVRVYKRGFATKTAALEYIPTLVAEYKAKRMGLPAPSEERVRTLEYYFEPALENKLKEGKQSDRKLKPAWRKIEQLHNRDIASLTVNEMQEAVDKGADSYYTARYIRECLKIAFDLAVKDEYVNTNKAANITLPKNDETKGQPYSDEEVASMWAAYDAGDDFMAYPLIMCYTGMMPGELLALKKESIDFDNGYITDSGLKTRTRREGVIVFPGFIDPILHRLVETVPGKKILRMNKDKFYKVYDERMALHGIRTVEPFGPYSCRHTAGTLLGTSDGIAPAIIQKIMRHSQYKSTQRYIHPDYSDMTRGINELSRPDAAKPAE